MSEAIGEKIRDLAVFYILLMTFLNLVPTGRYEKYVRFFMGLLLIGMILLPALSFLEKGREMTAEFRYIYEKEERERENQEMENLQKAYLTEGYESVIAKKIMKNLQTDGIDVAGVKVNIEGEKLRAKIYLGRDTQEEQKRRIKDELEREWGICREDCEIHAGEDEYEPVDHTAFDGTFADGDRTSHIR